jgi:hypothetical protein
MVTWPADEPEDHERAVRSGMEEPCYVVSDGQRRWTG